MFPTEGEQVPHVVLTSGLVLEPTLGCGRGDGPADAGRVAPRPRPGPAAAAAAMSGRRSGQAVGESAGVARSASSARTSDSRNRRCPPGVRMDPIHPLDAHLATVLGSTRNISATWCGVSSRSVFSLVTLRTYRRAPSSITDMFAHTAPTTFLTQSHIYAATTTCAPPVRISARRCVELRAAARSRLRRLVGRTVDGSPRRSVWHRRPGLELLADSSYHQW